MRFWLFNLWLRCFILSLFLGGPAFTIEKHIDAGVHFSCKLSQGSNEDRPSTISYKIFQTKAGVKKGNIMLFPSGALKSKELKTEIRKVVAFFNDQGFDVTLIRYGLLKGEDYASEQLKDVVNLYLSFRRRLKKSSERLDLVGFNSGAYLVAKILERQQEYDQPDHVIFFFPTLFDQSIPGTVIPQLMPPLHPRSKLFACFSAIDQAKGISGNIEYIKKYVGFGGSATFKLVTENELRNTSIFSVRSLLLNYPVFFNDSLDITGKNEQNQSNPAAIAKEGYSRKRHEEKLLLVSKEKYNLIMIGNSITSNFEKSAYQPVWNQFFAPRKALNLGFSGYRTENILWNIQNGELNGQSPKVVVLEIGTNNIDEKNYPTRHTAAQLADGIEAIVKLLRQKLPDAKIILLRCFPGSYDGLYPTSHRAILERASDLVSKLNDGKHIFYCDVNHVFLNLDGSIDHSKMDDYLHPTPVGAKAWAEEMEPLLARLMGDKSLTTDVPMNTAIVPVPKLEQDSYNWFDRHAEVMAIKDSINPEIVLIGNSITHFWGGEPAVRYADGRLRTANGAKSYKALFSPYRVMNLGFGWDRAQNVLWRLDHGELDGLHPRIVILDIGTNNTSETSNARMNTASEIVEGIRAVCGRIRSKLPNAKIVIMAVFPREKDPGSSRRILINEINRQLSVFAASQQISLVDLGPKMLNADGTFLPDVMLDFTHPSEKGYSIWADGIRPYIKSEMLR